MSIIKCPECGHDVSTKAPACPNCGVLIQGNLKRCPVCDTIMLKAEEECPQCHTRLVVDETTASKPTPTSSETIKESAAAVSPTESTSEEIQPQVSSQDPNTSTTPAKKSIGGYVLTGLIVILIGLIALIVWQMKIRKESSAEEAYIMLKECNDPQSYEDFIMRYPKSKHIADVQARLEALNEEETAWKAASITTQKELIMAFIEKYPNSTHHSTALHRIDTLDWQAADNKGSSAAYTAYISNHEAGDFVTEAYTARDEAIRRETRARNDSIAAAQKDSLMMSVPGIDNIFDQ